MKCEGSYSFGRFDCNTFYKKNGVISCVNCGKVKKNVDFTPAPKEYLKTLRLIIKNSINDEDIEWCKRELKRAGDKE